MMPPWEMMQICAPNVAPQTTTAIIQVESGGNPFAIGVNGPVKNRPRPRSAQQATLIARYYIRQGYTVDIGLMQINSNNLPGLGYTLEQMFDPCLNMQAGGRILSRGYHGAVKRYGEGQNALKAALSAYNTGNYQRGFKNGYVARYYRTAPQQRITSYKARPIPNPPLTALRPPSQNTGTTVYADYQEEDTPWNIHHPPTMTP